MHPLRNGWRRALAAALGFAIPMIAAAEPCCPDSTVRANLAGALRGAAAVAPYALDADVEGGVVLLGGRSPTLLGRERAVEAARTVPGVRAVVDAIEVIATPRTDGRIMTDVRRALAVDPGTDAWQVLVDVRHGVVTLGGAVESRAEKVRAVAVAKSVPGVAAVADHIGLSAPAAAENRRAYILDPDLANAAAGPDRRVGDAALRDALRDALVLDPRVDAERIEVSVHEGAASLTGTVASLAARAAALSTARNVIGMRSVADRLAVAAAAPGRDRLLSAEVRAAYARDPFLRGQAPGVTVEAGRAVLQGVVPTAFERRRAATLAARVEGVAVIDNRIAVAAPDGPLLFDRRLPFWDAGYERLWQYSLRVAVAQRPDWEVRDAIRDALLFSPFPEAEQVAVKVRGGVAVLEGVVNSARARAAAEADAYRAGATRVRNRLSVRPAPEEASTSRGGTTR